MRGSTIGDLKWVDSVPYKLEDAAASARIEHKLASSGTSMPIPDPMIAAAARTRGGILVAADGHFDAVEGLDYVDCREHTTD